MSQTAAAVDPYQLSLDCVHCGLCLSSCPTYTLDYNEADSPRGRIYLMRALYENRIGVTDPLVEHLDLCLGCRACETSCPAGVQYGHLLEQTRSKIRTKKSGGLGSYLNRILMHEVFPYPRRLRAMASLVRIYQTSGLESLANSLRLPGILGKNVLDLARHAPRVPPKSERALLPEFHPAWGERRARVALLTGCVMNELFGRVHRATIAVLQQNGCDVVIPQSQGCCGALHLHGGDLDTAKSMAERNLAAFLRDDIDAILVNSAGCGSAMKEYSDLFANDEDHRAAAETFSSKVKDVSEFLVDLGLLTPWAPVPEAVAYDDPCHLIHGQGVCQQPRHLLGSIPELRLVPLEDADRCCGGAGTYFVQEHESSMRILEEKITRIQESGAATVATANPGCAIQIAMGAQKFGVKVEVKHPMELLMQAYREPEKYRTQPTPEEAIPVPAGEASP